MKIPTLSILLILCFICCLSTSTQAKTQPPNVVFLLVDDMGYGDIAVHGNPIIRTPNFDALHDQSVRFTNFAVSPSCGPTRAALMTGKHEFLSGNTHTTKPFRDMSLDSVTVADLFKAKGYKTGIFGKWHLGLEGPYNPGSRGFDETLTCVDDNYKTTHFNPTLLRNLVEIKYQGYRTDIFFDAAIDFIERNKDRPFFCYLPTHSPHSPHKVPNSYVKPYEAYKEKYEGRRYSASFNGQVANVDENLGRLIRRLKELGLENNTILITMNDNGGTQGVDTWNDGRRGVKGTIWSGGTRAYSFWKWGNRFPPGPRLQMTGHVDLLPTLADLCSLDLSEGLKSQLEGDSLRPLLENGEWTLDAERMQVHHVGRWEDPLSWLAHKYSAASVRWQNYTLVRTDPCGNPKCTRCERMQGIPVGKYPPSYTSYPEHHAVTKPGKWSLYDIKADPFQSVDIATDRPEIVEKMAAHYEAWWRKVEVVLAKRYGDPE